MRFWQMLTWSEPDQYIEIAKFAEECGFEGVMLGDHGIYPRDVKAPYPYSPNAKPPMQPQDYYPDCWASIGAMAAVTETLRFSISVYVLPLRNVFEVARATGTLDIISNNRLDLGIGVGWMKDEFDYYGVDFHTRGKRCDEMIEILRKFWDGGMVEYRGGQFDFDACEISPAPGRQMRVLVGGASDAALRRAARNDGWIGAGNTPEEVPAVMAELNAMRADAGRDHLPFETIIGIAALADAGMYRELAATGMSSGVNAPFKFSLGERSSIDEKKRNMEAFTRDIITKC